MRSELLKRGMNLIAVAILLFCSTSYAPADELAPTWVRPDTDWSQYSGFLIRPLRLDDVKVIKPAWSADDPEEWTLQAQNKDAIQEVFRTTMIEGLQGNNGYPVVDAAAPNALQVEVELLSVTPWLKPGSESSLDPHVTTLGSGTVSATVALRDSTSRTLLLVIEGEKMVGDEYINFTPENNLANLKAMFTQFAARLRKTMDQVHQQ